MHRSGQPESGKYKPGDTLIIVAASISKPAPIVRWIKDGNYLDLDVDRGTNPKAKNHSDVDHASAARRRQLVEVEAAGIESCDLVADAARCNLSHSAATYDDKLKNMKHTLSLSNLRRQDAGYYQIEMTNYVETVLSAKVWVAVDCAKCADCVGNSRANIDTEGIDQGCICEDGYYTSTIDENGKPFENKLPFGCNICPPGGVCIGGPTLAAVKSNSSFYRSAPTDTKFYSCSSSPNGACSGVRSIDNQCSNVTDGVLCHACVSGLFNQVGKCAACPTSTANTKENLSVPFLGFKLWWWGRLRAYSVARKRCLLSCEERA